jgi:hypothetical protein
LLVIDGAIARNVELGDTISTELLGPGDLIRPWSPTSHRICSTERSAGTCWKARASWC